jgi:Ca2+-binding RTX toxin-like protein
VLLGGAGLDLSSYASATADLWIDMSAGVYSASGVWDVFHDSIEGVRGGAGNDSIFGDVMANRLEGGLGADALIGGSGDDVLMGEGGQDWIVGGDGNDRIIGGVNDVDVLTGGAGADTFDLGANAGWDVAFDFNTAEDRFSLGGLQWLGFVTYDADGDGQADDTLLGYAGGNFVALNVSGLTLAQWNGLVDGAAAGADAALTVEKADEAQALAPGQYLERGRSWTGEADAHVRGLAPELPRLSPEESPGWGLMG